MISIVTPSFRQLDWLRLCVASVGDQQGIQVEHIVQDGGTDGISAAALCLTAPNRAYELRLYREKDEGMYDAINRGLLRAGGEICAYLNCDEQYLPGALSKVAAAFARNPRTNVLLAGSLVVNREGHYLCSRPALRPRLRELRAGRMYNLSSSIFFRPRLFREENIFFDPSLRIVGDLDWLRRVIEVGAHVETLDCFTSTFSDLGTNLALSEGAAAETDAAKGSPSPLHRLNSAAVMISHRVRRLLAGHYRQHPFSYAIYTLKEPEHRQTFRVEKATGVWRNRL